MPYLLGKQRIRAYGSYNSGTNPFMLNTINNGSCWIPRQARCQAPCGAFYPDKKDEAHKEYLEKYKGWKQERKNAIKNTDNKRITGTVRVSSSEYQMNKASGLSTQNIIFNRLQPKPVYDRDDLKLHQWNQSSDRAFPSRFNRKLNVNVPSHGNSTKTSLTRHRPGAGAGGKQLGVDLKHNSYHRYLLKKKGLKPLRGEKQKIYPWNDPKPYQSNAVFDKSVQNNKWRKDSIVANMNLCTKDPEDCSYKPAPTDKPVINPTLPNKELPKSIVQEQDFFKTSLKETEPEKETSFFSLDPFDYTINTDKIVERKAYPHSAVSLLITDKKDEEHFYEKYDPKITYIDIDNNKVILDLKDIGDGKLVKIRKPIEITFTSKLASFNAKWDDEWKVNPPVAITTENMLIFNKLQNLTLVVANNN